MYTRHQPSTGSLSTIMEEPLEAVKIIEVSVPAPERRFTSVVVDAPPTQSAAAAPTSVQQHSAAALTVRIIFPLVMPNLYPLSQISLL